MIHHYKAWLLSDNGEAICGITEEFLCDNPTPNKLRNMAWHRAVKHLLIDSTNGTIRIDYVKTGRIS